MVGIPMKTQWVTRVSVSGLMLHDFIVVAHMFWMARLGRSDYRMAMMRLVLRHDSALVLIRERAMPNRGAVLRPPLVDGVKGGRNLRGRPFDVRRRRRAAAIMVSQA
jgi:hypothetical protein